MLGLLITICWLGFLKPTKEWCLGQQFDAQTLNKQVYSVNYNPAGTMFVYASADLTTVVMNRSTMISLFTTTYSGKIPYSAKFSKDGSMIAIGYQGGTVRVISGNPPFSNITLLSPGSLNDIFEVDFNEDSTRLLFCGDSPNKAYVYYTTNWTQYGPTISDSGSILSCKFDASNRVMVATAGNHVYRFADNSNSSPSPSKSTSNQDNCVDSRLDMLYMIFGSSDNNGYALRTNDSTTTTVASSTGGWILACGYSRIMDYFAFGSKGGLVSVANSSNVVVQTLTDSSNDVMSLHFSYDGNYLMTGNSIGNMF